MCVKLPSRDLNFGSCPLHPTNTYICRVIITCRVIIVPRMCGGVRCL